MTTTTTRSGFVAAREAAAEARERLTALDGYGLKPGDTVWTSVLHISRSGTSWVIAVYRIIDNVPHNISGCVARVTGLPLDRNRLGVKIGGCGMDMGFALVYELSHALFGRDWPCIGEDCPSNDHSNGDRDYTPHAHSDGGYALRLGRLAG